MGMANASEEPGGNQSAPTTQIGRSRFMSVIAVSGFVLGVICLIILVVVTVFIRTSRENDEPSIEEKVMRKFPGYFRTKVEQKELESLLKNSRPVQANSSSVDVPDNGFYVNASKCTASSKCTVDKQLVPRTSSRGTPTYHACCTSQAYFISPNTLDDIYGVTRTMAQFNARRQYFQIEECMQANRCTTCVCHVSLGYVTGVYVVGDGSFDVSWFSIQSCCKCVNTAL